MGNSVHSASLLNEDKHSYVCSHQRSWPESNKSEVPLQISGHPRQTHIPILINNSIIFILERNAFMIIQHNYIYITFIFI